MYRSTYISVADATRRARRRRALRQTRARRNTISFLAMLVGGVLLVAGVAPAIAAGGAQDEGSSIEQTPTAAASQPAPEPSTSEPAPEPSKGDTSLPSDPGKAAKSAVTLTETGPEGGSDEPSMSLMAEPGVGLLVVGPEPGVGTPYVYWDLRNSSSALVGGGTFELEGPRTTNSTVWGTKYNVVDCVVAPCTGLDRDSDPGEFQVVNGVGGLAAMATSQRWRVRPSASPASWSYGGSTYAFANTITVEITGNGNTPTAGQWVPAAVPTNHDFGDFVANAIPTTQDIVVRKRVLAEPTAVGGTVSGNIGANHAYTVGAVFQLYNNTAQNTRGTATGYTCTITTGGECTITVPNVNNGGANYNKRYWVVEEAPVSGSAADSTYIIDKLFVGDYNGPTAERNLVGLTQQVTATSAQVLPMVASGVTGGTAISTGELPGTDPPTTAEGASFGAVVNGLKDPVIAPKCSGVDPLRVALVIDQSASISTDQWTTFRNALVTGNDSVLGILRTAGSLVSVLGFGSNASTNGNGWHYGSTGPALLPTNQTTFENIIPTTRPGGSQNATNWDAALSTIQSVNAAHQYDLVLFVTDGAPNYILQNGTAVSDYDVTLRSLEAPIYAANALKVASTRVVAVGVGNGGSSNQVASNLRAVSGAGQNDYVQGDWAKIKQILTEIANAATCTLPIEVSKTTIAANGTTLPLAGGWEFTATKPTGDGTLSTPAAVTTTAGTLGTAKWNLAFTQPSGQSATLKLQETAKSGWNLTAVNCTVGGVNFPVTIVNGSVTLSTLTPTSGKIACVFTNSQDQFGNLAVTKGFGTPMPPGAGPAGVTFTGGYSCTLSSVVVASGTWSRVGTGAASLTPTIPAGGTAGASQQVPAGASCTVTEIAPTTGMPNTSWVWDTASIGAAVTIVNAQTATVTVTNKAKRVYGNFQVTKVVPAGSTADASNQYSGAWSCVLGAETPVTGTWGPIVKGATWASSDANLIPLGATCSVTSETRPDWPVAADHSYQWDGTANLGTTVLSTTTALPTITVTNATKRVLGTASWNKVAASTAALLAGSGWVLNGPGAVNVTVVDCTAAPCPTTANTDQDPDVGEFRLVNLAWGAYTLTEATAPPGYLIDSTPRPFTIGAGSVVDINLGAISNQLVTPPSLPLTGGLSRDAYLIAGFGALLLALAATGVLYFRTRRKRV